MSCCRASFPCNISEKLRIPEIFNASSHRKTSGKDVSLPQKEKGKGEDDLPKEDDLPPQKGKGKGEDGLPKIRTFTSKDEFYKYLGNSNPTQLMVLNFTVTTWCNPCQQAVTPFSECAKTVGDEVKFANVDVDYLKEIADQLGVVWMPTFLLVKVRKEKNSVKKDKNSVKKDNVQGDKGTSEHPAFNSQVKKDDVQGDEGKAKLTELNYRGNRYTVKEFDRVVGFQEKEKLIWKQKLVDLIETYKHSTES